jgi:MFS family permease
MTTGITTQPPPPAPVVVPGLTASGRWLILITAFLGWLFAGVHMSITQLIGRPAAIDLLERSGALEANELVLRWFAWLQCAFLFGAAAGGLVFGWLGDRIGRSRGMALSILTYSVLAAATSMAQSPLQLVLLWFLACLGVGGMWPNGVALVSEAWSSMSRPLVAGVIGTAANIGIFLLARTGSRYPITPESWRWVLLVGAVPVVLGIFCLFAVPESPRWLAARREQRARQFQEVSVTGIDKGVSVFRPPWLGITVVGIVLATVPMMGGWGSANWMVPWADKADTANPSLKADVGQARALTGIVGSLLGGWIASVVGRRLSYLLVSLCALAIAQYTFWFVVPTDSSFLMWVAALGFFSGIYFGWMPLFLPELFPVRIRSTGAGVSFNFGRIVTAVTIFTTGALVSLFGEDYALLGRITSLVFALGMVAICFAPDTSRRSLED